MKIINDARLKGGKIPKNTIIRSIVIEEKQSGKNIPKLILS